MNVDTLKHLRSLCIAPIAALCLMPLTALAETAPPPAPPSSMPHSHSAQDASGSVYSNGSTMGHMDAMHDMKMSGDPDKDFAMMMKMHHQKAIQMAQTEIDHGKSPELKAMAQQIIKDQTKEMGQLDAWMKMHP